MSQVVGENSDFSSEDGIHIYTVLQAMSLLFENCIYSFRVIEANLSKTGDALNIEIPQSFQEQYKPESKQLEVEVAKHR